MNVAKEAAAVAAAAKLARISVHHRVSREKLIEKIFTRIHIVIASRTLAKQSLTTTRRLIRRKDHPPRNNGNKRKTK